MKKMRFNGIGVDSGLIMICDKEYYKKYGFKFESNSSKIRKINPGSYDCSWFIKNTWNGHVSGEGKLIIMSSEMIISDPCYCIKDWDKFLKITNMGNEPESGTVILDKMGGDGTYTVHVFLEEDK